MHTDTPYLIHRDLNPPGKGKEDFRKVFPYIICVAIGEVIHNWITQGFIERILGDKKPCGVILVGTPMYGDIFKTIPIVEALLKKGAQLGTVLSFMMAVTALSIPTVIMLGKAIKPKL